MKQLSSNCGQQRVLDLYPEVMVNKQEIPGFLTAGIFLAAEQEPWSQAEHDDLAKLESQGAESVSLWWMEELDRVPKIQEKGSKSKWVFS